MNTCIKGNRRASLRNRTVAQRFSGTETTDGDGVKLTRIIGSSQLNMLDPFLLLDCFESDNTQDYIGGFPTHPHRGFETVTYLLNGRMRHKDNAGHEGMIEPGGVQWMTAARGIQHSEMPEQEKGLMKGFQLWVNLPSSAKMNDPAYQEYPPEMIPLEQRNDGTEVRVIAGETSVGTVGPVVNRFTFPTYMDVSLVKGGLFEQTLEKSHNAFIYVIDGSINVLTSNEGTASSEDSLLHKNELGVLTKGERLLILSGETGGRFLFIAGHPLNEPVARGGPFVMNTKSEILQAFDDYRRGNF